MPGKALAGKKVLMVIAPKDFRDEELFEPKKIFEEAGAGVSVASVKNVSASGMLGGKATPDLLVSEANADEYDAVVVVGGMGSPEFLWSDKKLHKLLRDINDRAKVVAGICLSGAVLAKAGLLEGKQATVYKTDESLKEFEKGGAKYINKDVVTDGRIVTASGPHAAKEFGKAIVKLMSGV